MSSIIPDQFQELRIFCVVLCLKQDLTQVVSSVGQINNLRPDGNQTSTVYQYLIFAIILFMTFKNLSKYKTKLLSHFCR